SVSRFEIHRSEIARAWTEVADLEQLKRLEQSECKPKSRHIIRGQLLTTRWRISTKQNVAESARDQHFPERDFCAAESVDPEDGVALACMTETVGKTHDFRISSGITQILVAFIEHRSQA